jgi:hypothetical protein
MNNLFLVFIAILVFVVLFRADVNHNPTQGEIQDLSYVDKTQYIQDYPYPQISRTFKQLGKGQLPFPLSNESEILPSGGKDLRITRTVDTAETMNTKRVYLPDFYRKDRMGKNPSGTEELRPFLNDNNKSESSWTDDNVSEHPKFYNADIKDELTNIGAFFDKNNQYNDITSSNTESLSSDKCYTDKSGNYFCTDNTRLQLIPPKLISDPKSCYALNNVGLYKDNNYQNDMNDKVMNGGAFYNGIRASNQINETWSSPPEIQVGDCQI